MSARRPSRLEQSIAAYRARLLALDAAALQAIESAYLPGQESILSLIDLLVTDIEAAGTISASEAARLARATELLRLIEAETARLARAAGQIIPAAQQQAISQALQRAESLTVAQAPDAARAAELARQWTGLNRGALENLVGALSDGSPLNDWLQAVVGETVDEARRVLMDGITRGVNPRDIGRDLARVSGMPLHRAQAAARTMTMDAYRSASLQVMAENSDILKGWTWSSAHGPRTCLACLARDDGTVYPLTVQFMGAHVACRCSPSPALLDDDDMPPIETGQEWFERQPQDVKDHMVPVGLRDEFRAGKVRIEDMATLQRDDRFGDRWRQSTISEARRNAEARRAGRPRPEAEASPKIVSPDQSSPTGYRQARTLEEAEAYAREMGVETVTYRNPKYPLDAEQERIALNAANAANEALMIMRERGLPVPPQLLFQPRGDNPVIAAFRARSFRANQFGIVTDFDNPAVFIDHKAHADFWTDDSIAERSHQRGFNAGKNRTDVILHEFGHFMHFTNGRTQYLGRNAQQPLPAEREAVARTVSRYAATNEVEFVAETFVKLIRGDSVSDDAMNLYRELGGYVP